MDLSRELLKQFANITNTPTPKGEATVYATVVEVEDSIGAGGLLTGLVQIDGSTERTPITSTVKITAGNRVIVRLKDHTATVIGNVNDPSASDKDVTTVTSRVESAEGNISEIVQSAEKFTSRIEDAEGDISLLYQAAGEIAQNVTDIEGDLTDIRQTAGEVRVTVQRPDGKLETFITTAGQWNALYTSLATGKVVSGFYFDFTLGRFVYDGTGIYRSADGLAYIQIEDDGIAVYAEDGTGGVDRKIHIGFNSVEDVAYPYVLLGAPENVGEAGIVKKFKNGLFIGNGQALSSSGDFNPQATYAGIFVDTKKGKTYVVNGTEMKDVYAGAEDDVVMKSENVSHKGITLAEAMPVYLDQAEYDARVAAGSIKPDTPYFIQKEV